MNPKLLIQELFDCWKHRALLHKQLYLEAEETENADDYHYSDLAQGEQEGYKEALCLVGSKLQYAEEIDRKIEEVENELLNITTTEALKKAYPDLFN